MTKEEIVKLAVDNNLVLEVYDYLHLIVLRRYKSLECKTHEINSELKLIKKFANVNKLDVIKDILKGDEE